MADKKRYLEDANVHAFEGGDTHPETAKAIHERNMAIEEASQANRDAAAKKAEADREAQDAQLEAERKLKGVGGFIGEPVVTGAAADGAGDRTPQEEDTPTGEEDAAKGKDKSE